MNFENLNHKEKIMEILNGTKIDRKWFYYLRDMNNHPVITVCLMRDLNGLYHRGISICSKIERPIKQQGRERAIKRALEAMKYKEDTRKINRLCAILRVEETTDSSTDEFPKELDINTGKEYMFKSYYDTELTPLEKKLTSRVMVEKEDQQPTILQKIRKFFK
jgi:hypothetical protein